MFDKIQYISQGSSHEAQLDNIRQALDAGCIWIQLRYKTATIDEITQLAIAVKNLCTTYQATFIINDHPHIAHDIDADGVHLGLSDTDIATARQIVGNKIIGGTANTLEHVLQRIDEGCNYIGLGPFRFTATKEKLGPIVGLHGYERIMYELSQQNCSIPIYAIGGIGLEDVRTLIDTGVYGIAMSAAITQHPDKKFLLQQLNTLLYEPVANSQ